MLSVDLTKYGFNNWSEIKSDYAANKDLVLMLPKRRGIYIIRAEKPFPRVKGESDIIYIGQGVIQHRVQLLLRSFLPLSFRNYMSKHTARVDFERMMRELNWRLELGYVLSENAKVLERLLLTSYRQDHIECPPLNHTRR